VSANASSLLTLNPIIVYATLALYGLLFAVTFLYMHNRFRMSSRVLSLLKNDWADADSKHSELVETAQQRIARLSVEMPVRAQAEPQMLKTVTSDTRTQVVAMGKRGLGLAEIARNTGLPEGEVDVLLGLARMQR
jgi:DNA-directed RNA polymerase specialized sigma24 family protein